MDPNLYNATIGAPAAAGNTLGASNYNEIANMGAIDRKLPTSTGLTGESLGIAQNQVQEQARAAAAAKAAAAEAKKKAADMSDPNKYRTVQKADGGYDFFDPEGNQVDIATLSQRTGTKPTQWIKDSENPIDIQYREDQKNLDDYVNAIASRDEKSLEAYRKATPDLTQYDDLGGIHRLIDRFKQTYQRYYVPRSENAQAWGHTPGKVIVPRSALDPTDITNSTRVGTK